MAKVSLAHLVCLPVVCGLVTAAALPFGTENLEGGVKDVFERVILSKLFQNGAWSNNAQFLQDVVKDIKDIEKKLLPDIIKTAKSHISQEISKQTMENVIEHVIENTLGSKLNMKKRDEDLLPNYLNMKYGGFGK